MIHRDRGGNCVERRLLALMISVALLGAVLPGLIGRRGAAGCTKSDGYIAPGGDTGIGCIFGAGRARCRQQRSADQGLRCAADGDTNR